jgi:hypothetical protein
MVQASQFQLSFPATSRWVPAPSGNVHSEPWHTSRRNLTLLIRKSSLSLYIVWSIPRHAKSLFKTLGQSR